MFNTKYNNIVTASTQRNGVEFKFGLSKTIKPCVAEIFLIVTQTENGYEQTATKEIKYCMDDKENKMVFEILDGKSESITISDYSCCLTNRNGELLLETVINEEVFQIKIDVAEPCIPF